MSVIYFHEIKVRRRQEKINKEDTLWRDVIKQDLIYMSAVFLTSDIQRPTTSLVYIGLNISVYIPLLCELQLAILHTGILNE